MTPFEEFLLGVENWPISWEIGGTWWFPMLESIHVITATIVVGSLLMVDLRLLGLAARQYSVSVMSRELVPWTWGAFVISCITGFGMFITRAFSHVDNPAMQWKMGLLVLAGANMAYFHFRIYRSVDEWNDALSIPVAAKAAGALSLLLWSGVMLAGRWVGHIV